MPVSTLKKPRRWDLPYSAEPGVPGVAPVDVADIEMLLAREPFSRMSPDSFPPTLKLTDILRNDCRLRRYRNGDLVVRLGDYGTSAFLILDGSVRVAVEGLDPDVLGRTRPRKRGLLKSLLQPLTNSPIPESRDPRRYPQGQVQPLALATEGTPEQPNVAEYLPRIYYHEQNVRLEAGQIFGELAALGRIPRAASIVSEGDSLLLEIRWQGLRDLRKYDEGLREHVDRQYRRYGLVATLQAAPLLDRLDAEAADEVARHAEFESYGAFDWYGTYKELRERELDPLSEEPLIAAEGDRVRGLILVRSGFARVSRRHGHGERTLNYLGPGQTFGLTELLEADRSGTRARYACTLRAIGYLDIVVIPAGIFRRHVLPQIEPAVREGRAPRAAARPAIDPGMTEFIVENRFNNGTSTMIIDLERCTRCDDCVRACASGHDGKPRFLRHGKTYDHYLVANACMQCVDPVCMIGCPTGAIHRNPRGGEVLINDLTCIGCGVCARSCPYHNIRMVEVRDRDEGRIIVDPLTGQAILKATKCDLCVDFAGGPACERACPHDALKRVDMRALENHAEWLDE